MTPRGKAAIFRNADLCLCKFVDTRALSEGSQVLALDAVQDGEERVEIYAGEERAGPVGVSHDRMGSAIGIEFDPHRRFVLYAFRQPAADHELGH